MKIARLSCYSYEAIQYNLSFIPRPVYMTVLESATRVLLLLQKFSTAFGRKMSLAIFITFADLLHSVTCTQRTHTDRSNLDIQLGLVPNVRPCFEGRRPGRSYYDNLSSLVAK